MTAGDSDAGDEAMRRRLRWRARRGVLELDLLFSAFLDSRGQNLSAGEARALEALLEKDDDELLRLLIYNVGPAEDQESGAILNLIKSQRSRR